MEISRAKSISFLQIIVIFQEGLFDCAGDTTILALYKAFTSLKPKQRCYDLNECSQYIPLNMESQAIVFHKWCLQKAVYTLKNFKALPLSMFKAEWGLVDHNRIPRENICVVVLHTNITFLQHSIKWFFFPKRNL